MKKIEITVSEIGGLNIHSEEIGDPFEAINILGVAIQALQQKVMQNSNIVMPPGKRGIN